jgi:CRP-like cAMP-binding protein
MKPDNEAPTYSLWGADNVVYGPVELPRLVDWVQQRRVPADAWVYLHEPQQWHKAAAVPELQLFYQAAGGAAPPAAARKAASPGTAVLFNPALLRRVKIFAGMSDSQLKQFAVFMELVHFRPWDEIIREGAPSEAMYLLLEGEVRVRLMIRGKESVLATLAAGDFFGEVALLDYGPRSADVIANTECTVVKMAVSTFQRLAQEKPELAAPVLFAIGQTLIRRIRADNRRYRDSIALARIVRG